MLLAFAKNVFNCHIYRNINIFLKLNPKNLPSQYRPK